jgi:hypothetical protein
MKMSVDRKSKTYQKNFREGQSVADKGGKSNRGWQSFRSDDANAGYREGYDKQRAGLTNLDRTISGVSA